ncbi:hypothetical protein D3C86_1704170 [compost metagenome]
MPAEPAAVPIPKASERCCGVTWRAKAERMTLKEPAAMPSPTSTPPPKCSQKGEVPKDMQMRPAA